MKITRPLVKSVYQKINFFFREMVLLGAQNISSNWCVRKYLHFYAQKFCLSKPMIKECKNLFLWNSEIYITSISLRHLFILIIESIVTKIKTYHYTCDDTRGHTPGKSASAASSSPPLHKCCTHRTSWKTQGKTILSCVEVQRSQN